MSSLGNIDEKYSKYDSMSTAELNELLRRDFYASDPSENEDAVLYIMEVLAQREEMENNLGLTDDETAWKEFNEIYRPFEDEENARDIITASERADKTANTKGRKPGKKKYLRTALIAAVAAVLALATVVTTTASNRSIWDVIAEWTKENFEFFNESSQYIANEQPDVPSEYETRPKGDLQAVLDTLDIDVPLVPTWLPKGYEHEDLYVDSREGMMIMSSTYSDGDKLLSITVGSLSNGSSPIFEKDESPVEEYEAGGVTHYLMTNNGTPFAAWANGIYYVDISGDVTREELLSIIDSVYER